MSYCVHCGVELADHEKECPLCGTVVIDPNRTNNGDPMFSRKMEDIKEQRINPRFIAMLIFWITLLPFAATAGIFMIFSLGLRWTVYVFGAEVCVWAFFLFPLHYQGIKPYWNVLINTAVTAGYLFLIAFMQENNSWYLPLALPLTLLTSAVAAAIVFILRRKKLGKFGKFGWTAISASVYLFAIDICITHFVSGFFFPLWSWFVGIPFAALGVVCVLISGNAALSEWIRKNMFI
ncbi:MAG: zinc ribbon domain-containing protein [Clostridia bacterium]|nr:zinc ribbon domain-containing protein [Clostridia bacterium]